MTPAQIRQAVRILQGMGYVTAGDVLASGKTLRMKK